MQGRSSHNLDAAALRKVRNLGWLSDEQVKRLAAGMTQRRVKRHETIFYEGEISDQVYVLISGVAKLSFQNRDNERVLVGLVGPGEIFGVSSLLPQTLRPFRCDAFSDCAVVAIKPGLFVDVTLGTSLASLRRVTDVTVGRWWTMLLRYANFLGLGLRERLAGALLELASKFGVQDARGTILTLSLTHGDLAELVGASRQRITEHLNEFERQNVIMRDGRRLILLPAKLIQYVGLETAEWDDPGSE